jgi:two-component sensor histidine kinase
MGRIGDQTLSLAWAETEGPPVQLPARRGFGTTLIEQTLTHELDAEVSREFRPTGLHCTMTIPLTGEIGHAGAPGEVGARHDDQR